MILHCHLSVATQEFPLNSRNPVSLWKEFTTHPWPIENIYHRALKDARTLLMKKVFLSALDSVGRKECPLDLPKAEGLCEKTEQLHSLIPIALSLCMISVLQYTKKPNIAVLFSAN